MRWLSKSKPKKDTKIILGEFPSWAAIHSAKLVSELKDGDLPEWTGILKNEVIKSKFTNCLIGAHVFYLSLAPEGGFLYLFGEKVPEQLLSSLPEEAKKLFVLAVSFYEKKHRDGKDEWLSSIERFYGIKIDPLDANVALVIEHEVREPSDDFSGLIGYLLPILNRLRVGQVKWLGDMVKKWSVAK